MQEEWRILKSFDNYEISSFGNVDSRKTSTPRKSTRNKQGVEMMTFYQDGRYITRALSLLVAETFLSEPPRSDFNTPIHINGDRSNCRVDNLMWRPRWFAIIYHQERREDPFPNWRKPFDVIETEETFDHPKHCAIKYGLLEGSDFGILHCLMNRTNIFPTGFTFRW